MFFNNIYRCLLVIVILSSFRYLQAQPFAGGNGTEENPWQIETPDHLNNIRNYLGEEHGDKHYMQTADINLDTAPWNEGEGWVPIGTLWPDDPQDNEFYGNYDGRGHNITGLYINREHQEGNYQALFGVIRDASIRNTGITDVNIRGFNVVAALVGKSMNSTITNCFSSGGEITGRENVGGLLGRNKFNAVITGCYSTVEVSGGFNYTGGLVAQNEDHSTIRFSYAEGQVNGGQFTGGLVGRNYNNARIESCFSRGDVPGQWGNNGGLVGRNEAGSVIRNSYSRGNVRGDMGHAGGFVGVNFGEAQIINCFSTGTVAGFMSSGGLVGLNRDEATVIGSYWDTQSSMRDVSDGGEGRTTEQMTYRYDFQNTFIEWDFDNTWSEDLFSEINDGYPVLSFQLRDRLDAPQVTIAIAIVDDVPHVILDWEAVEDALTYRIFAGDNPYSVSWGEPLAITKETIYSEPLSRMRFYCVVASADEAP